MFMSEPIHACSAPLEHPITPGTRRRGAPILISMRTQFWWLDGPRGGARGSGSGCWCWWLGVEVEAGRREGLGSGSSKSSRPTWACTVVHLAFPLLCRPWGVEEESRGGARGMLFEKKTPNFLQPAASGGAGADAPDMPLMFCRNVMLTRRGESKSSLRI